MHKIKKYFLFFLRKANNALPFTITGLLLLLISIWALESFGIKEQDLVVSLLCACLTSIIIALSIFCFFIGRKIKQKIKIIPFATEEDIYSQTKSNLSFSIDNGSIPAFFNLKLKTFFYPKRILCSELIISGRQNETRHCAVSFNFPYRGYWELSNIQAEFSDALGFSKKTWKINEKRIIRVLPKPVETPNLSIIASSAKPGDEINLPRERSGEPFDIKQYENSDGVRRILWKTYARSRQLLVRKPELAIIPEGEVAVYLIAGKNDDNVASACMQQIKTLLENDILVIFGSDTPHMEIAKNYQDIENLMLKAAHDSQAGSGKGINQFIGELRNQNYNIAQINIFAPENSEYLDNIYKIEGIKINLIIVQTGKFKKINFNLPNAEINFITPRVYA